MSVAAYKKGIQEKGFCIVPDVFTWEEIDAIAAVIEGCDQTQPNFRKTNGLFAIRQFLKTVPGILPLVFNEAVKRLTAEVFGSDFFVVKSIYFDKPEGSNWFVPLHQDLTISVSEKFDLPGYGPWTVKQDQFAVRLPMAILENIFTLRIHLDDTDEYNGALRIIEGSHLRGIYRSETADRELANETVCRVPRGGAMIMKPLLLHASGRTVDNRKRRVVHIEFSNQELTGALKWAEKDFPSPEYNSRY
jgi:hypothetical protein